MAVKYDPVLASIGSRIVKHREELGMSASELAIRADLTSSTLSLYESGQRAMGVDKLHRIAVALKVPLSYLQSEELDEFSAFPPEAIPVMEKLKGLTPEKQRMIIKMFSAQLATL